MVPWMPLARSRLALRADPAVSADMPKPLSTPQRDLGGGHDRALDGVEAGADGDQEEALLAGRRLAGAFFAGAAFFAPDAFFATVRFAGAAFLAGAFFAAVVAVVTSSPLCVMRRSNRSAVSHGLVYALR